MNKNVIIAVGVLLFLHLVLENKGTFKKRFNYHLVKLSSSLIEYVVIHELAHITFKNHSKDFWKLVYKHLVDYKVKEEKIRVFEKLI